MKRLITIMAGLCLIGLLTDTAKADPPDESATAEVTAEVLDALSITKVEDVNFGNVPSNQEPYLDPRGENHEFVGTAATVGEFNLFGQNEALVILLFDESVTLSDNGNDINFAVELIGDNGSGSQTSPGDAAISNLSTIELGTGSPNYTLWLGGTLDDLSGKPAGTYTGEITITVEYQ